MSLTALTQKADTGKKTRFKMSHSIQTAAGASTTLVRKTGIVDANRSFVVLACTFVADVAGSGTVTLTPRAVSTGGTQRAIGADAAVTVTAGAVTDAPPFAAGVSTEVDYLVNGVRRNSKATLLPGEQLEALFTNAGASDNPKGEVHWLLEECDGYDTVYAANP